MLMNRVMRACISTSNHTEPCRADRRPRHDKDADSMGHSCRGSFLLQPGEEVVVSKCCT